jgi:hypothetical protein
MRENLSGILHSSLPTPGMLSPEPPRGLAWLIFLLVVVLLMAIAVLVDNLLGP